MGVNTKVTAQSARVTTNAAERLINCILKNIKDCAEMGMDTCCMSFSDLSSLAVSSVRVELKNLGFEVEIYEQKHEYNVTENACRKRTETAIVVTW